MLAVFARANFKCNISNPSFHETPFHMEQPGNRV